MENKKLNEFVISATASALIISNFTNCNWFILQIGQAKMFIKVIDIEHGKLGCEYVKSS